MDFLGGCRLIPLRDGFDVKDNDVELSEKSFQSIRRAKKINFV